MTNILNFDFTKIDKIPDILWFSPPCTTFSVASISTHWTWWVWKYKPKTKESKLWLKILDHTIYILSIYIKKNPDLKWYLENPRWIMRKVIDEIFEKYSICRVRKTITYCQYWANNMKPTDIWTNDTKWIPKKICKNWDSCHVSAPRWSRTWTQWLKNAFERGKIPDLLFDEILCTK